MSNAPDMKDHTLRNADSGNTDSGNEDTPNIDPSDLAFLKTLVSEGPSTQANAGLLFLIAGSVYSLQCVLHYFQIRGQMPQVFGIWIASVPTVILMAAVAWLSWNDRHRRQTGVAQRALNAAWGSAGLTNMVMIVIFGYLSITRKDFTLWMLYAVMVCAVQGAVWYIAAIIRKKLWLGAVSAGWFASALGTGFNLGNPELYILIMALALFVCMAVPGYVMWRGAIMSTREA